MSRYAEFRAGWPTLLAAVFGIGCGASPVPYNMVGHLTGPLQAEFGWGRGQIMLAVTVFGAVVMLLAPWFGALIDRKGVRKVGVAALIGFSLSWMATTLTTSNIFVYYAIWIVAGVLGGASIPISWTRAVNAWFVTNRGLALAIALLGTGFAGIALNLSAPWMIENFGWRGAVIGSALPALVLAAPIALLFLRDAPDPGTIKADTAQATQHQHGATLKEASSKPTFWIMFAAFAMVALAFGGLFVNFVPMLMDAGFEGAAAGAIASTIGVSLLAGRLIAGALLDRFWAPYVAAPLFIAPAIACMVVAGGVITPSVATMTAVLIGFAAGVESDLIAYLAARYYGIKNYARIYGVLYMAFGFASAISPPLYGWSYDIFGSYRIALMCGAALFVVSAVILFFMERYPAERAESDGKGASA
ncbi:MAG: MFS transporter [Pseudomonadota bacterium]